MRYIHAGLGSIIAFFVFIALSVVAMRMPRESDQAQVALTVSTFLFAILVGFYISRLNNRYDKMRDLISDEDAHWLSFYELSLFFPTKAKEEIIELIDRYYIVAYDFTLGEYYKYNAPYLHRLYEVLRGVDLSKDEKLSEVFDVAIGHLDAIEELRNESSVLSQEHMSAGQWTVLLILSAVMIFSMYQLELSFLLYFVLTVLMPTVLVMLLLIMRDLQNFRLMGGLIVEESGQEVIESMGKLRYYSKKMLDAGLSTIPRSIKTYRLGMHEAGSDTFDIKEVRV